MSAIVNNIPVQTASLSILLGMKTEKKLSSNVSYSNYTSANTNKWFRQSTEKLSSFDWDINMNELEFE